MARMGQTLVLPSWRDSMTQPTEQGTGCRRALPSSPTQHSPAELSTTADGQTLQNLVAQNQFSLQAQALWLSK